MDRTRKRKTQRVKKVKRFDSNPYKCVGRIFQTKRQAAGVAKKYRKRAKKNRARVVRAPGGGYLVYRNPCGRPIHSKWHYIHQATKGKSPKQKAIGAEKAYEEGYKKYLTRGY